MIGSLLAYSLLASTLLTVVWVVYKCTLANAGCFRFNRIFLLLSIIIAFILPPFILKPERIVDIDSENIVLDFNTTEIANVTQTVTEHIMPVWNYIVTLYLIGIGAMIIYFLVSLVRLLLFIIRGEHIKNDGNHIVLHRHNSVAPFAWGGYIMMPRKDWYEYGAMIVRHEKAHIKCRH